MVMDSCSGLLDAVTLNLEGRPIETEIHQGNICRSERTDALRRKPLLSSEVQTGRPDRTIARVHVQNYLISTFQPYHIIISYIMRNALELHVNGRDLVFKIH